MHEAPLMADLIRRISTLAEAEHARRVTGVTVWLGALSHMSAEHFAEHFQDAAAGTVADGARLGVTVSDDLAHPNARGVVLEKLELET